MSRTRHAVRVDGAERRNSGAEANVSTRYPAEPSNRRRERRTGRSSSTIEIIGPDLSMAWEHSTRSYRAGPGLVVDLGPPRAPATPRRPARSRSGRDHARLAGEPDQLREGAGPHLLHDPGPMHLDRLLADVEFGPDLLVQHAGHHQGEDSGLSRGQGLDATLNLHQPGQLPPVRLGPGHRLPDRPQHARP